MAIVTDKETAERLQKISGKRLRSARLAARMSEAEASAIIGHKGSTQLSLCESGQRLMPIVSMYKLAEKYAVSIDYLLGRINDPIADPVEHNQGLLARSIGSSVETAFNQFTSLMSQQAIHYMKSQRDDHTDLKYLVSQVQDLHAAFERFKQLNPEFEEDMKGGARVDALMGGLQHSVSRIGQRIDTEAAKRHAIVANQAEVELSGMRQLFFPLAAPA